MSRNWLETIAGKAKLTPDEASRRLRRWGIAPDRAARPARSFVVERIAFVGEKKGETTGKIDFTWADLEPGVWAVTNDRNVVGKSTVLEVVLWCLRGSPKNLQVDVRSWLAAVALDFTVDEEHYRVAFDLVDDDPVGRLERRAPDGAYHELDSFASDDGFALVMARFMMGMLDLDPLPAMQGGEDDKDVVEHGWLALSNAFYFGGDHKYLLADTQMGGLPARLLQMYIGLPWTSTKAFVNTAKKEIDQERTKATRALAQYKSQSDEARKRLEGQIETARRHLASLPTETTTAKALRKAGETVAAATRRLSELQARAAKAQAEAVQVREVALDDERAVRNLRETIVATQFFNGLKPECCPRCETTVATERVKAETTDLACSLCAEATPEDRLEDVSEALEEAAEARAAASKKAAERATADNAAANSAAKTAGTDLSNAKSDLNELLKGADFAAKRNAELDLARLEGALKERSSAPA